jgi:hypothetical protein
VLNASPAFEMLLAQPTLYWQFCPQMSHQPDNISAGTQVVTLVEIRGPNQSLVHPRGAVGVVTRTPTGTDRHFLVRFPDGFEKSLTAEQLEVQ